VVIWVGLVLLVVFTNVKSGATLSGWDSLHPEWDVGLYFRRVFFGAWQTHQGLGAPAAQAHLAELTRLPWVGLLQILPETWRRYSFILGCYALGGAGMWMFLTKYWLRTLKRRADRVWGGWLGSLFYLFNLITLQLFYVPLEMLAVAFAVLPWMWWSLELLLERFSWRSAGRFFALQVLATAMAHTPTLFYVTTLVMMIYAGGRQLGRYFQWPWQRRPKHKWLRPLLAMVGLVLAANLWWAGSSGYFAWREAETVVQAKSNQNFSPKARWYSQAFGNLGDVLVGRNFLFNWRDWDWREQQMQPVFDEWESFWRVTHTEWLFYLTGMMTVAGMWYGWQRKKRGFFGVVCAWVVSTFFLINLNFPTAPLYALGQQWPAVREALRLVFTKIAPVYLLIMTIGWSETAVVILEKARQWQSRWPKYPLVVMTLGALSALVLAPQLPALAGRLLSDKVQVAFPSEYAALRAWLRTQNATERMVTLPLTGYAGWRFYAWPDGDSKLQPGYQGAGFSWFGVPQAVLERDFDRWSPSNETAYRQLATAINQRDSRQLALALEQYQISLLLVDRTATEVMGGEPKLSSDEMTQLLMGVGAKMKWQQGDLAVWQYPLKIPVNHYLSAPIAWEVVRANPKFVNQDVIYQQRGNYVISTNEIDEATTAYPWLQLQADVSANVSDESEWLTLDGGEVKVGQVINWPARSAGEEYETLARFDYDGEEITMRVIKYQLQVGDEHINLPQLPDMSATLTEPAGEILVVMGERYLSLRPGEHKYENVVTTLGEPTQVAYYNLDQEGNYQTSTGYVLDRQLEHALNGADAATTLLSTGEVAASSSGKLRLLVEREFVLPLVERELQPSNCDYAGRGRVSVMSGAVGNLTQKAQGLAAACNTLVSRYFSPRQAYLLRVRGENFQGLGLQVYVDDDTLASINRENLLPEGKFAVTLNVRASTSVTTPVQPRSIVIQSQSLGQYQSSENWLEMAEIVPIDQNWLSQMTVQTPPAAAATIRRAEERLQIVTASGDLGYRYQAQIKNHTSQPQLLVLGQTYDQMWRIDMPAAEHVIYNGWANGWLIPSNFEGKVTISYQPQYWAWWGLGLGVVTGGGLVIGMVVERDCCRRRRVRLTRLFRR
jgi:hypothetical protein